MVDILLLGAVALLCIVAAFYIGKREADYKLTKDNATLKRVQRNLNALVLDQKHQIDAVNGLWATDEVKLIQHHANRERFFRIGYPEHRL